MESYINLKDSKEQGQKHSQEGGTYAPAHTTVSVTLTHEHLTLQQPSSFLHTWHSTGLQSSSVVSILLAFQLLQTSVHDNFVQGLFYVL